MEPKVKFKGGGSFVEKSPQFSADGQTLFVAWKNVIVSYNTKTAKRLRELRGLRDPIVGFQVHNMHKFEHVTACSSSGEIISWKVEIGFRVLKTKIPQKNVMVNSFNLIRTGNVEFLVSWTNSEVDNRVCFSTFNLANKKLHPLSLKIEKNKYSVATSHVYPYYAVVQNRKLFFQRLDRHKVHKFSIDEGKHFTCVACHPQEECVITGDSLGRVLIWYNLKAQEPSRALFHWHTLPVRTVSFSASGTNFYSGAGECTLVRWYFDDQYNRDFLPRLPSTIEHITVADENQFIAVATADNVIRVLDAQFGIVSIIQHLVLGSHFPAGITFDQRTKAMVLNGMSGHVQFYSPHDMTLLYNLDVVCQNRLTQERNSHIENTNVTKIAVDQYGLWLATVEERVDVSFSFELRLKFWEFNTVKQLFQLNTSVELPHEKSVTHMLFQPAYSDELRCVTVGNDKKFKVWQLVNADTVYHKGNAWSCSRVGFYRDLPCNALSFSSDGSLVAVGFGPTVTTWSPDTCDLKCSLLHPSTTKRLTALQFGTASDCHLLVAATTEQLSVWNLLSLTMIWTVPLQVSLLVASPVYAHMAVFTTDGKLFVFSPGSSEPVFGETLKKETENIVAAAFVPSTSSTDANSNWYQNSQLFFISSKHELFSLDAEEEDHSDSFDILSKSNNSMVPQIKSTSVQKHRPVKHYADISCNSKQMRQLLDAPVHTMVPIRLTCGAILRSLILEHKSITQKTK